MWCADVSVTGMFYDVTCMSFHVLCMSDVKLQDELALAGWQKVHDNTPVFTAPPPPAQRLVLNNGGFLELVLTIVTKCPQQL